MKIHLFGTEFSHADFQTDKNVEANNFFFFCNFAYAPKKSKIPTVSISNFIEINPLCTTQLTVVFYNWLHQQHVSTLLCHHQVYKY